MSQSGPKNGHFPWFAPRSQISHVVFDFDGTLSWLRHGWPELMVGLFMEEIPAQSPEAARDLHDLLLDEVLSLNGKSSIYQMESCASTIASRSGPRVNPDQKLAEYLTLLETTVRQRCDEIERGTVAPEQFVVHGARALLELLRARGLILIILSGTAEPQVKEEAQLLGLAPFFGRHIYGGSRDLLRSSKKAVLERLLLEEQISGEHLLSFGDGPVEIRLTKEAGGLAVGVASDEDRNGSGKIHPQKESQLRNAGADLIIPDYRNPKKLVECLLGS